MHKDFLKYSIIIYLSDSSSDLLNSKSSLIVFTIFLFFIQGSDRTGKPGKLRELDKYLREIRENLENSGNFV